MADLKKKLSTGVILLLAFTGIPFGCAPKTTPSAVSLDAQEKTTQVRITGITAGKDAESSVIQIAGSAPLTYTSVKQADPLAVVLYFPDTVLGEIAPVFVPGGVIKEVKASTLATGEKGVRVEIALAQDTTYVVNRENGGLKLLFPEPSGGAGMETMVSAQPTAGAGSLAEAGDTATSLSSITAKEMGDHAVISVEADGRIQDFTTFTLADPPRIVYDIQNIKSRYKTEQIVKVGSPWVNRVRYYTYPDKVRVVVDTQRDYLLSYTSDPTDTGMTIQVGRNLSPAAPFAAAAPVLPAKAQTVTPVAFTQKKGAAESAQVNRIDFSSDPDGKSTVVIGTTKPVEYTLEKSGEKSLLLTVLDAKLPEYRQRPLITTKFDSAVDKILPHRKAGTPEKAFFTFELREAVPYHVEQKDNLLLVHFEASSVPAKPMADAVPVLETAASRPVTVATKAAVPPASKPGTPAKVSEKNTADLPRYTGERVALDFYETDIKNVFRILREVSGMNFAIDKDVAGKVTLSFDEPVPWDQVLDLVLKMNQLGKVMEGSIIRIATLATLNKEQDERQAAMTAAQKSKEQETALEPLATEYIPVNYSKAKDEILPHIKAILTKDRGTAEVDERSNLIVITDTQKVVDQAKQIVQRLDKVTPQVMIEARVVEVNSDISNVLGIDWNASRATSGTSLLNGGANSTLAWDVAMNFPAASTSGVGFTFANIAGSTVTIDATINALETQSKGKIISSPKVVTLDNKKATIKQGLEVGYMERDDSGGSSTKFKNVDLLLEVTPHVTPDSRVSMNVYITKNDIAGTYNDAPLLSTNEATTEFLVNDGETVVIGGILKKSETNGETGFPILKDIPGLKWLFGTTTTTEKKNELLIFITPKIVTLAQRPVD